MRHFFGQSVTYIDIETTKHNKSRPVAPICGSGILNKRLLSDWLTPNPALTMTVTLGTPGVLMRLFTKLTIGENAACPSL
jgi:hypothetical protein